MNSVENILIPILKNKQTKNKHPLVLVTTGILRNFLWP